MLLLPILAIITVCITTLSNVNLNEFAKAADEEIYYATEIFDVNYTTETETINYSTKTSESYMINRSYPQYYNLNTELNNWCANVAGANVIGFYDRYYDELIPNCTVGLTRGSTYTYYAMGVNSTEKQAVINSLYTLMGTDAVQPGTTQAQFKNGLISYVNGKSKSASFNSVMSGSSFDLNKAIAEFKSGRPICLFMSGYNFSRVSDNGSTATLSKEIYSGNHIAVVFGYEKVNYYSSDGSLVATKIYLEAATGFNFTTTGRYIVNNNGTLNDAESVNIY